MSSDPYSDRINAMPKYAASTTLTDPKWNNTTVIDGGLVEYVSNLKKGAAGNIVQYGCGAVSHALL